MFVYAYVADRDIDKYLYIWNNTLHFIVGNIYYYYWNVTTELLERF